MWHWHSDSMLGFVFIRMISKFRSNWIADFISSQSGWKMENLYQKCIINLQRLVNNIFLCMRPATCEQRAASGMVSCGNMECVRCSWFRIHSRIKKTFVLLCHLPNTKLKGKYIWIALFRTRYTLLLFGVCWIRKIAINNLITYIQCLVSASTMGIGYIIFCFRAFEFHFQ